MFNAEHKSFLSFISDLKFLATQKIFIRHIFESHLRKASERNEPNFSVSSHSELGWILVHTAKHIFQAVKKCQGKSYMHTLVYIVNV